MSTKTQSTGQPIETAIGPPFCQAKAKVVNVPARTEMIVNEIAKLVNPLQRAIELLLVAELVESLLVVGPCRRGPRVGCLH